jgi:hypothetical protein
VGEDGCIICLVGTVEPDAARELLLEVEQQAAGHSEIEVNFGRARGDVDVVLVHFAETAQSRARWPRIRLTGLTQHHQRLLAYVGLALGLEDAQTRGQLR